MPTWSWSGSGSVSDNPDDPHAFFQSRVALFNGMSFALWLVIGVVSQLAAMAWVPPNEALALGSLLHAHGAVTVLLGIAWIATRRGRRPPWVLETIDFLSPLVQAGTAAAILPFTLPAFRPDLGMVMGFSFISIARAAIVPSGAGRTFVIATIGGLPIVIATYVTYARAVSAPMPAIVAASQAAVWLLLGSALAMSISRVIYGLRQKVHESARLGRYILEKKVGEGGMGAVFRARHVLLRRPTAVKVLDASRAGEAAIARFEREVQLTSEISHPNVVAVYDYGRSSDGGFYYAMEHLDGLDLQRLVEIDGPQPPGRVVHILVQAAEALAEAHAVGLVHRDVKPGNIMLCRHDRRPDHVKVLDFGLVKQLESPSDVNVSTANAIAGTPLYISPEAITDPEKLDGRSDLYALGAVGFFLLTGTPVFRGGTVLDILARAIHERVELPSKRLGAELPAKLEAVVMACLARNRDERPADAASLKEALLACDDVGPWTAREAREWWSKKGALLTAANGDASHASPFTATLAVAARSD